MLISVPKEVNPEEYPVSLIPAGAEALTQEGHRVLIETGVDEDSGFTDE
ncbi:uncharacterized protein METZ01_LOCUS412681 [marine metagenome]|uniref:Alanine dehydrogenase/pyridine nucleotide transhydrogenase N-terminal domain-containing protein n=1 Tax=marine metagenome TaxID=408172 RepID=A0A382WLU4_9ZZZZ